MTINVGQIPYLNCEPFFYNLAIDEVDLRPMHPRDMGPMAKSGDLDAGPFSLIQARQLRAEFESLGDMGISIKGPVKSILLYSRVPLLDLFDSFIGVTQASATAAQLIKVILEQRYRVRPREYVGLESGKLDAFLLIGDDALTTHGTADGFPHRYDLAEEWQNWKDMPFVFATWMVRRDMEPLFKRMLANKIKENLAINLESNLTAISTNRRYMGLSDDDIADYLLAFRYNLDDDDWRGMREFEKEYESLSLPKEATI